MDILSHTKEKMLAAIEHLKEELKAIRTGRANSTMLDNVQIEVYGTQMRIKDLATVTTPEPRSLVITPFDPQNKGHISKSIEKANLGFMPSIDGHVVRIRIPPMDENLRKEMVKLCHKRREDAKVSIRNVRRDSNEIIRKQKSEGHVDEDAMKRLEKQIQDLTDKFCKEADDLAEKKEKEVSVI